MKSSVKLSIPQPCHESWGNMTSTDKGRFCLSCQKTVTDFTKLSDEKIIELLQSKQGTTCGRFLPHQLNRTLSIPAREKHRKPFISIAAITAALIITTPFAKAANLSENTHYAIDTEDKQTTAISHQQDTARFISGEVMDKQGQILPGATVMIKNTRIGTAANVSGKFSLPIPDNFKKKVIVLEISFIGYQKKIAKVVLNKELKPLKIQLDVNDRQLFGEVEVHFEAYNHKRISPWTRFRDAVRNAFS